MKYTLTDRLMWHFMQGTCYKVLREEFTILIVILLMARFVLGVPLALFFSSFGLIISNYSDTMQQAIFVMWFFVVILLLLSGLFTPTRSMPALAYLTTYINPMHYFIEAIRTVFVRGGSIQHIWHQLLALLAIALFMANWAVQSYKKNS